MNMITLHREIPVRYQTDVFVAGGGPAGVAAALAAAQNGASVFLAEGQGCFGGMGTSGLVPEFVQLTNGETFLAGGIGRKIINALAEAGGHRPEMGITLNAEIYKRVLDKMVKDAGVDFTFNTHLIGVEAAEGEVSCALLASKNGIFAARAKMYIDCTGDGDLCVWAGAPYEKGTGEGVMMSPTVTSLWAGVNWEAVQGQDDRRLEEAFAKGDIFELNDRHLPGMRRTGEHIAGGNIGHSFGGDGTDDRSVTEALVYGRNLVPQYERYYKEYLKGYERIELVATCATLGVRESRRIMGDYVLSLEDFQSRASFDDEIGRFSGPVDIHAGKPGSESYQEYYQAFQSLRYGKGESYGIPYRTLTPKGLSNVLVAGRCISTDRAAQSSVRLMPGCFITGQAAGTAAAMAASTGTDTRGIDVGALRGRLREMGAYLP